MYGILELVCNGVSSRTTDPVPMVSTAVALRCAPRAYFPRPLLRSNTLATRQLTSSTNGICVWVQALLLLRVTWAEQGAHTQSL